MKAERQQCCAVPVGEEAEVADADEAAWQQMEQEPAQELLDSQSHEPLFVAVGGVAPAEGDVAVGDSDQSAVGDGDAMGVSAEIAQHVFRSSEGPLGVDHPIVAEQHSQPGSEGARMCQRQEVAVELKRTLMEGAAQPGHELAAEDAAEHADGQKEGMPGGDPAGVIRREAAGSNYAVDMRMKLQALVPAVEHAEETDLGSKMSRVASNLKQRLGTGVKEQVVDQPLVLQRERNQFPRQSKDGMHIAGRQQFPFPRLEPAHARVALASWAMAISTRVVRDGGRMSAASTAIAMSTQRGGAAAHDGQQHFSVLPVDPLATVFDKGLSRTANDVGHLQQRPAHELCLCPPCRENVRASSGLAVALR